MNKFILPEGVKHVANTSTKWITIPEDKLKNIFYEYLTALKSSHSWIAPASLFLSLALTLATTEKFKNFLTISAVVWEAMFYIGLIVSFIFTCIYIVQAIKHRKETSVEFLVDKIAENSVLEE